MQEWFHPSILCFVQDSGLSFWLVMMVSQQVKIFVMQQGVMKRKYDGLIL
jgi:hypothetical protein